MNELDLSEQLADAVEGWGLRVVAAPPRFAGGDSGVDGLLRLPDATELPFAIRSARRWEAPLGFLCDVGEPVVIVQPYINPKLAERYRERDQFYVDFAGNAWIWLDDFRLFVEGRRARPDVSRAKPGGVLHTASELRVAFLALAGVRDVHGTVRQAAQAAGVSVGSAQAALTSLRRWGFLADGFDLRREQELLDLWIAGFGARLLPTLRSRLMSGASPLDLARRIQADPRGMLVVGEAVAPVMASRDSLVLYGEPPWIDATRAGRLHADPEGTITLREAFWNTSVDLAGDRAQAILTCAELLASPDERLRAAGTEMRETLR